VIFRKRITPGIIATINEYLITDVKVKDKAAASKKKNKDMSQHTVDFNNK
jgi:hypothetical protein